jgi:selenocysteine lyase/cysteine desulfurase
MASLLNTMIATGSAQLVLLSLSCLISLSVELLGAIVLEWDNDGFVTELGFPTTFTSGASRFDMGGRPNIVLFPPLVAGMEQVLAWGPPRIEATLRRLTDRVVQKAKAIGFTIPAPGHVAHIVGLRPTMPCGGIGGSMPTAEKIVNALKRDYRVHVAARWGSIRVSPHVYNTEEDVDRLMVQIAAIIRKHRQHTEDQGISRL